MVMVFVFTVNSEGLRFAVVDFLGQPTTTNEFFLLLLSGFLF